MRTKRKIRKKHDAVFLSEKFKVTVDFCHESLDSHLIQQKFNSSAWSKRWILDTCGQTMWNLFLGGGSDRLFQLIHSSESSSWFCELCSSGLIQSWLFNFLYPGFLWCSITLPACFLRYFHICILLGFFFAHDVSSANKSISSQFLFQLNHVIFTYLFELFHSFVVGFYVTPFSACWWFCGSRVQSFLGSCVTFLSHLKAENEKVTAVVWD